MIMKMATIKKVYYFSNTDNYIYKNIISLEDLKQTFYLVMRCIEQEL